MSALRRLAFPTLAQIAEHALANESAAAAKERLRDYVASRPGRPYEPMLNVLGYSYLGAENAAAAVTILELVTELFPQSANAWDSLGEATLAAGDREEAIRHYRRSLELNPANTNAVAKLQEMGAETAAD